MNFTRGFTEQDQFNIANKVTSFSAHRSQRMGLGMTNSTKTSNSSQTERTGRDSGGLSQSQRIRDAMKQQLVDVTLRDSELHASKQR